MHRPSSNRFKNAIYEQFARVTKALSSPRRLELLDLLTQGPRTVEALARAAGLSPANASQRLKALRSARLVEAEKNGLFVTYRLADAEVAMLFLTLRRIAESRLAEVELITREFLAARQPMESVDREELLRRVRDGAVTLLDVRPREEYAAGHIPGALSLPLPELERRLGELSKKRDVVAYCRGPYCVMALDAVELLRGKGFRAFRLEDAVLDWRARGLPVEAAEMPRDA